MLDGEHAARAREAALDFVDDEDDAVTVAKRAQRTQELGRRDIEAAFALHGFDDDGRHPFRIDVGFEELIECGQRLRAADAVVLDRERDVVDVRQHRAEAGLVRLYLAGEAHAAEGAAVESAAEGDHRRTLRVVPGDLHGVLDCLRPGGEEDGLLRAAARHDFVQPLGERDVVFVGRDLKAGV